MEQLYLQLDEQRRFSCVQAQRIQYQLLVFFSACSVGWVWEFVYVGIVSGQWVNRGVLHGPWLPIYGFGAVLMLWIYQRCSGRVLPFFAGSILLCAVAEYVTSVALEALFHQRWWDYSHEFMNLDGRICLKGLLFFALAGFLFARFLEPLLRKGVGRVGEAQRFFLSNALLILFVLDIALFLIKPNFAGAEMHFLG